MRKNESNVICENLKELGLKNLIRENAKEKRPPTLDHKCKGRILRGSTLIILYPLHFYQAMLFTESLISDDNGITGLY